LLTCQDDQRKAEHVDLPVQACSSVCEHTDDV
jgi:hypothetical protein